MAEGTPLLLLIETATTHCSVAVAKGKKIIAVKEENAPDFRHSDHLHLFIQACMKEAALSFGDLSGVGVSMGPGSYTGLRIGVATAKGLCFANDIPLLAVNTLEVMAQQCHIPEGAIRLPMIDARRMEIFTLALDRQGTHIRPCSASIVDASFKAQLPSGEKHLFGSGAEKCKSILNGADYIYHDDITVPSAVDMVPLITEKFTAQQFEDLAYFEPYYLKDFYTTAPKIVPSTPL